MTLDFGNSYSPIEDNDSYESDLNNDNSQTDYEINSLYITFINKQFCCDTFLKKNTIEYIKNCDWINKINKKNEIFSYEYREYEKK